MGQQFQMLVIYAKLYNLLEFKKDLAQWKILIILFTA